MLGATVSTYNVKQEDDISTILREFVVKKAKILPLAYKLKQQVFLYLTELQGVPRNMKVVFDLYIYLR